MSYGESNHEPLNQEASAVITRLRRLFIGNYFYFAFSVAFCWGNLNFDGIL